MTFNPGDKVICKVWEEVEGVEATVVRMQPSGDVLVRFDDPIAKHVLPIPYGQYEQKHVTLAAGARTTNGTNGDQ